MKNCKEIQWETTINEDLHFALIENKLHLEYEDPTNRKYWWHLKAYNDCDCCQEYEEDAYIFFNHLYLNYKSIEFPNFLWKLFEHEILFQVEVDISNLRCMIEENQIKESLSHRTKQSLILLQDRLKKLTSKHPKYSTILTISEIIYEKI